MRRPRIPRLAPETSGFNRRRIAAAAAVVAVTLALVTFVLTRGGGERTRHEPAIPITPAPEPRELLEELEPPASEPGPPPILEPDLGRLFEAEPPPALPRLPGIEPAGSPRVERAFSRPVKPLAGGERSVAPGRGEARPGSLGSMFEELEAQNAALGRLLEEAPPLAPPEVAAAPPAGEVARPTHVQADFERPPGRWVLRQGTVIPAQLVTEVNSDLPGEVAAQVLRDVRNSGTFERVLIPRGTKLLGRYDSGLRTGQNRLAIEWSRLLLPGGSSITVDALPAVDARGRSGLSDKVNHHTGRVFGNALLLSLVSAGFEAAQPSGDTVRLSAGELAVEGASRELEQAATELLRRGASIPPTVRIRAGTPLGALLRSDLTFDATP